MRIKLVVQRHSLPPANVLWTIGVPQPPYSTAGATFTVSQFLEHVNDIIPLESEEWGLEDYAVEVEGFECLHFSELTQILKEDDEVCIRPLQTSDLRFRRISGRHQITADGRHLIDGVAFGRPFLRRTERPAIRIPPRKRRRVLYDVPEDDNNEDIYNDQQLTVHTDSEESGSGQDEGEDDAGTGEEDEDLNAEVSDIQRDLQIGSGENETQDTRSGLSDGSTNLRPRRSARSRAAREGLGLEGSELLSLRDENGRPYPGNYDNPLLELYSQDAVAEPNVNQRKRKRNSGTGQNATRQEAGRPTKDSATPLSDNRRESSASSKSVRFDDDPLATPATVILAQEDSEDTEDDDFEPPAEVRDETDESDKENAEPKVEEDVSSEVMSSDSESSSSSESDDESDDTSSSGSSSGSSSEAETEREQPSGKTSKVTGQANGTSSSTSSSASSSESHGGTAPKGKTATIRKSDPTTNFAATNLVMPAKVYDEIRTMKEPQRARKWLECVLQQDSTHQIVQSTLYHAYQAQFFTDRIDGRKLTEAKTLMTSVTDLFEGATLECISAPSKQYIIRGVRARNHALTLVESIPVPPGKGKVATKKRNERRRTLLAAKRLQKSQSPGGRGEHAVAAEKMPADDADQSAGPEFNARRQALLDSIASGGVELDEEGALPDIPVTEYTEPMAPDEPDDDIPADKVGDSHAILGSSNMSSMPIPSQEASEPEVPSLAPVTTSRFDVGQDQPLKPRSKIDLASSRRLLFGALGLRTPKSKEDEKALQAKLMQNVKPMKLTQEKEDTHQKATDEVADNDESWRSRIDLRAVECCYDGIELSTPPFPFVQRWDPQQKRGYRNLDAGRKGGKGKKRKRNKEQYYDDGTVEQAIMPATKRAKSASPLDESRVANGQFTENVVVQPLGSQPTSSDLNQGAVNEQLLRESQEAALNAGTDDVDQEDLPPLPNDMTVCPALTLESAKPGTVIAFKKLDMSVETNWQPRISEYRTAIVDESKEDGTLYMTLAFRDRSYSEVAYDPETGERLYNKFEMPGYDNEEDEEADGHLELPLAELIEPRIIQAPEMNAGDSEDQQPPEAENHYSDDVPPARVGEAAPQVETIAGDLDETWDGFEESRIIDQPEGTDKAEDVQQSVEPEEEATSPDNAILKDNPTEQRHAIESPIEGFQEPQSPAPSRLDEVAYPDLGDKLKDLVTTHVVSTSTAASGSEPSYQKVFESVERTSTTATAMDSKDQLRQEIAELIKDAGWRSSIHIPAEEQAGPQPKNRMPQKEPIEVNVQSSNPPLPKFNGFSHSPRIEDDSDVLPAEVPETYQGPTEVADSISVQPLDHLDSLYEHYVEEHITNGEASQPNQDEESFLWNTQAIEQITTKNLSSSASPPQSPRIENSKSQPQNNESQVRPSISPPATSKSKPNPRSTGIQKRTSASPPKSSNPKTKARNSGPQPKLTGQKNHNSAPSYSEDEELPNLEKLFASRIASLKPTSSQSSANLTIKAEDTQTNIHAFPAHKPRKTDAAPRSTKSSSITSPLPVLSPDEDSGFLPASQYQSTPCIDLTLSSDPVEPTDSAYEGDSSLPNGPGWARKTRSSQRARSVSKGVDRKGNGGVALVGR